MEKRDFPLPNDALPPRARKKNSGPSPAEMELRDVALHHVIRKEGKPYSEQIVSMDLYFSQQGDDVSFKEVQDYLHLIATAEIEELKSAEVILCTCTASSSYKILFGSNVKQVPHPLCSNCFDYLGSHGLTLARRRVCMWQQCLCECVGWIQKFNVCVGVSDIKVLPKSRSFKHTYVLLPLFI